jgi:hypothetical protein
MGFLHTSSGQCCIAGSRMLVERKVYDEVVEKSTKLAKERVVGDPFKLETRQGPQVDKGILSLSHFHFSLSLPLLTSTLDTKHTHTKHAIVYQYRTIRQSVEIH